MKLHVLSDLHLETGPYQIPVGLEFDVLVAAGDISSDPEQAIEFLRSVGKPVVLALGNHDYWSGSSTLFGPAPDAGSVDMRERMADIERLIEGTQVHLLECDELVLGGVRFLGCTYWTAVDGDEVGAALWDRFMNDSAMIGASWWYSPEDEARLRDHLQARGLDDYDIGPVLEGKKLNSLIVRDLHEESREWLESKLREPFDGKTILVTHHAPAWRSVALAGLATSEDMETDLWPCRSDLSPRGFRRTDLTKRAARLVGYGSKVMPRDIDKVDVWIHGHLHAAMDYMVEGVRCLANPRGHVVGEGESAVVGFNPARVLDTDTMQSVDAFRAQLETAVAELYQLIAGSTPYAERLDNADPVIAEGMRDLVDARMVRAVDIIDRLRDEWTAALRFPTDLEFMEQFKGFPSLGLHLTAPEDAQTRRAMVIAAADQLAMLFRERRDPQG